MIFAPQFVVGTIPESYLFILLAAELGTILSPPVGGAYSGRGRNLARPNREAYSRTRLL